MHICWTKVYWMNNSEKNNEGKRYKVYSKQCQLSQMYFLLHKTHCHILVNDVLGTFFYCSSLYLLVFKKPKAELLNIYKMGYKLPFFSFSTGEEFIVLNFISLIWAYFHFYSYNIVGVGKHRGGISFPLSKALKTIANNYIKSHTTRWFSMCLKKWSINSLAKHTKYTCK